MDGNRYQLNVHTRADNNQQQHHAGVINIAYLPPDIEEAQWIAKQLGDIGLDVRLTEGNEDSAYDSSENTILLWSNLAEKVWYSLIGK